MFEDRVTLLRRFTAGGTAAASPSASIRYQRLLLFSCGVAGAF